MHSIYLHNTCQKQYSRHGIDKNEFLCSLTNSLKEELIDVKKAKAMPYDEYRVTRRRCFILKAYCCCVGTGNNLNLLLSGLGIAHRTHLDIFGDDLPTLRISLFLSLSDHIFIVSCVALLMTPTRNDVVASSFLGFTHEVYICAFNLALQLSLTTIFYEINDKLM